MTVYDDENGGFRVHITLGTVWTALIVLCSLGTTLVGGAMYFDQRVLTRLNAHSDALANIQVTIEKNHQLGISKRTEIEGEIAELRQTIYDFMYNGRRDYDARTALPPVHRNAPK